MIVNPYNVLGIKQDASDDEIKKAYRKLSKEYHPDKSGGDDVKFKQINEAYDILTNPKSRAEYEQRKAQENATSAFYSGFSNSAGFNRKSGFWSNDADEMFREFMNSQGFNVRFSYGRNVRKKIHGENIKVRIFLTLEEAFHGKNMEMKVKRYERINTEKRTVREKRIRVQVPKGAKPQQQLVLRGQGNQGLNGGSDGDLTVLIEIKRHNYFMRKDNDLYARVDIPFTKVILGGSITFKNIDGELIGVNVPWFSQQDDEIEIKDKGMPVGNSDIRGNLHLIMSIQLPNDLSEKEKELLKQMDEKFLNNVISPSKLYDD